MKSGVMGKEDFLECLELLILMSSCTLARFVVSETVPYLYIQYQISYI